MNPPLLSRHAPESLSATPSAVVRWCVVLLAAFGLFASRAAAQTIYLLTNDGKLATTTVANPGVISTPVTITGVIAGETLVAIDVRPQNQQLYALGVNPTTDVVTLYHLSPETAHAAPLALNVSFTTNGVTAVDLPTSGYDMDFNPAADRLRVVAQSLNFRLNPNTGAAVDGDNTGLTSGSVTGTNPDGAINGGTTIVTAAAYTNNRPNNGNITTLYTLDPASNSLYRQNPPNVGTQISGQPVTLGGSTLDFSEASLDIPPGMDAPASDAAVTAGFGYMVAKVGGTTSLYRLNLVNGQATNLGTINLAMRSSAIRTDLGAAVALSSDGSTIVRFDPASPGTITTVAVSLASLAPGESLVGVDERPQTGQLMALGVNATANTATLYLLDPQIGAISAIGTPGGIALVNAGGSAIDFPDPATTGYGMDFNPAVDRLRVVTGSGLNFRVNPGTGSPVDGDLGGAGGSVAGPNPDGNLNGSGVTGLEAAAYTNSYGQIISGSNPTTLYTLSATNNSLQIQNPPNAGTQTLSLPVTLGGSALDLSARTSFDISSAVKVNTANAPATGKGWLVSTIGGVTGLYQLDLATGVAKNQGTLGAGATAMTGLVVYASKSEIGVAYQGSAVADGSTRTFGETVVGVPITRTVTVANAGSAPLDYSTSFENGPEFVVTQNPSGTVPGFGSVTLEITYTPTVTGPDNAILHILSSDSANASFDILFNAAVLFSLANDAVTVTTGPTRLSPLANDGVSASALISSVSDPAIVIDGRSLIIPEGFSGTFTYQTNTLGQGTVVVSTGTPASDPFVYSGLLLAADHAIVGWAKATISAKGVATVQIRGGASLATAKIKFPSGGNSGSAFTKLGNLSIVRNVNGTVSVTLSALGGNLTGILRAARPTSTVEKHHIALASIHAALPGGGYLIAKTTAKGAVSMVGLLPDGLPFTSATTLGDNGSFAFYAVVTKGAKPPALVGGELVLANLTATDVTGELHWSKLPQTKGAKGTHLGGFDTTLTANGSLFANVIPLTGAGTLQLSGGNLPGTETGVVTVNAKGIPNVPIGSLKTWTGVSPKVGKFTAKVLVPGITKQVVGSGVYLPKSNRAWGYFPGKTVGGRIELTVP